MGREQLLKNNLFRILSSQILDSLQESKPTKKAGAAHDGWITRVLIMVPDTTEHSHFAIQHPVIHDPVWEAYQRGDDPEAAEAKGGKKRRRKKFSKKKKEEEAGSGSEEPKAAAAE